MKRTIITAFSIIVFTSLFVVFYPFYSCACISVGEEFAFGFEIEPEKDSIEITRNKIISKIPLGSTIDFAKETITAYSYANQCKEDFPDNIVSCSFDTGRNIVNLYNGYQIHFILNDKNLIKDVRFNFYNWHLIKSGND